MVRLITLACLLAALLTAGCNGSQETDEVAFVLTVGIDAAPGGQLNVTYRVAKPSALGGEGGKGGAGEISPILTINAPSLAVARDLLNSQTARAPSMVHVKVVVIGEELARKGIGDAIGPLLRFREFRGSMFIHVADGTTAEKLIRANKPPLEKLPTRWLEGMMSTSGETGYYPRTFLHDFYVRLKAGSGSPYATLSGIKTGKRPPSVEPAAGEKTGEYLPGEIDVRGGNPGQVIGTALFRGDKMVGKLTSEETRMLAMLTGEFRHGYITVEDPLQPKSSVNINLRPGRSPKIDVTLADGRVVIDVDIMLEGEVTSIGSGINYEDAGYNQQLEDQVSAVVRADIEKLIRYTQQLGSDPVNFGKYLRSRFATYDEFRRFDFDGKYPAAEVSVRVTTQLRRTGLMWKTTPIRKRQ
ncbi:Ger(x)C family spore germination protein [Anaeroselena agilis]|uniref:Ger(X)C family spore germination protein n=1 Tax=Anaeroselena agilis TaxID=3063788 RepID=A0ABU3NSY0_9FIRM|nr:Ger(x)C family spore germination protein [Selenomonadales bacterium 4137-cl]